MNSQKTLISIFPNWATGTLFIELRAKGVPWADDSLVTDVALSNEYFANRSGDKIVSRLIDRTMTGETITQAGVQLLADIIAALYLTKWDNLWATQEFEYNPIENYDMIEQMSGDETIRAYGKTTTRTDNLTHAKTGTETEAPNITHTKTGTETEEPDITNNNDLSVYGFNSVDAVPSEERVLTSTGQTEKTYNTSEHDSGTNQVTYNTSDAETGTQTHADSGRDVETRNYTLTRHGNIGVTTSQQMIESERNLWLMWEFFNNVVFPDIDRVLTIPIY